MHNLPAQPEMEVEKRPTRSYHSSYTTQKQQQQDKTMDCLMK